MPKTITLKIELDAKGVEKGIDDIGNGFDDLDRRHLKEVLENLRSLDRVNFKNLKNEVSSTSLAVAEFAGNIGSTIVSKITSELSQLPSIVRRFIDEAVAISTERQNAFKGLESIAVFKGVDPQAAQATVQNLRLVKAGIIDVSEGTLALKNLLQTGFGLDKAKVLIERFSDSAAFGKQAALSYGQAIASATEGIKNQNSILVDNAGVTKNISVILKERGFEMQDLSDKVKGASALEALYAGLIKETAAQVGDADKLIKDYTGTIAALDQAEKNLYSSIGDIISQNPEMLAVLRLWTEEINGVTDSLKDQDTQQAETFSNFISWLAKSTIKTQNFAQFTFAVFSDLYTGFERIASSFAGYIDYGLKKIEATITYSFDRFTDLYNGFANGINLAPSILGLPQLPTINRDTSKGEADFYKNEQSFNDLDQARVKYFQTEKGWFQKSAKALLDGTDRLNEFQLLADDTRYRLKESKNAISKQTVDASKEVLSSNGGGGGKGSRLSDAGIKEFASNRQMADFQSALRTLPIELKEKILSSAADFGIPAKLALAQIYSESSFKTNANSGVAFGLTQFKPSTASRVLGQKVTAADLQNNPDLALSAWGKYMTFLFNRYGDWELATLAYHQGEGTVDKLVAILDKGKSAKNFFQARPKGKSYVEKIAALSGIRGDAQFQTTIETDSAKQELQSLQELNRARQDIIKTVQKLGLTESDYHSANQAEAAQSLTRLDAIKNLTGDWTKQIENADEKLFDLRNQNADSGDKLTYFFDLLIEKAGLSSKDVEFLTDKLDQLKGKLKEVQQATSTRSRLVDLPFEKDANGNFVLPDKALGNLDKSGTRDGSDRQNIKDYNSILDSLNDEFSALQRNGRELTTYEQTLKDLGTTYKDLSQAEKEELLAKAQQIDSLRESQKAFEETSGKIEDLLGILTESGTSFSEKLHNVFKSIADSFKQMLIKMAADFITSKIFAGQNGSSNSGGGGIGGILQNILGGGSSSGSGGLFGGSQGGGIFSLLGGGNKTGSISTLPNGEPAFNVNGSSGGALSSVFNIPGAALSSESGGKGGILSQLLGKGGIFGKDGFGNNLGTYSTVGAGATILGSLISSSFGGSAVGRRVGGILSGAGAGLSIGASIGSLFGPGPGTAIGAAIGAAAGAIFGFFSSGGQRKKDEKTRTEYINSALASFGDFDKIIQQVNSLNLDPASGLSQAAALGANIRSNYLSQANTLKDNKTRNIAIKDVSRIDDQIKAKMAELQAAADSANAAGEVDRRLNTSFATGVYMDKRFANQYGDYKRRNGILPGSFTGVDNLPSMLAMGEMVLNPEQIAAVKRNAGSDPFKNAGIPNYATGTFVTPSPSVSSPSQNFNANAAPQFNLVINGVIVLDDEFEAYLESQDGTRTLVKAYDKGKGRNIK